jgi:hypothetical protein
MPMNANHGKRRNMTMPGDKRVLNARIWVGSVDIHSQEVLPQQLCIISNKDVMVNYVWNYT